MHKAESCPIGSAWAIGITHGLAHRQGPKVNELTRDC